LPRFPDKGPLRIQNPPARPESKDLHGAFQSVFFPAPQNDPKASLLPASGTAAQMQSGEIRATEFRERRESPEDIPPVPDPLPNKPGNRKDCPAHAPHPAGRVAILPRKVLPLPGDDCCRFSAGNGRVPKPEHFWLSPVNPKPNRNASLSIDEEK